MYEQHCQKKWLQGCVQGSTQNSCIAKGLMFWILKVEELHFVCSADQLHDYYAADLCLLLFSYGTLITQYLSPKFSNILYMYNNLEIGKFGHKNFTHHHHHHHIRFRARFPLPRVGPFDKSSSKTSSPLRAILRVSRVHI